MNITLEHHTTDQFILQSFWIAFYNPKALGTVMQYSVISGCPHKTVLPLRKYLAVLPPLSTLYNVETRDKFWIEVTDVVFGVGKGGGLKSPRTLVCDCS